MPLTKSFIRLFVLTAVPVLLCIAPGCGKSPPAPEAKTTDRSVGETPRKRDYVFALIAKSQSNPVFQAARVGAEDAAEKLSRSLGAKIQVLWRTPNEEDSQKQAEYIEQLTTQGVDGISISCSVPEMVTPAINDAVQQGVAVMCFDADAPESLRFCFHGTDDVDAGRTVLRELAAAMGPGKHIIAIPGGNQNAMNLQKRIHGVLEEAKNFPDITVRGVYYHKETPQDAAARVEEVQTANPDIDGWAMVSAVCLFTDALMKWEPGKVKIVGVDALPVQLPYLRKGVAQKLLAQETYQWGYRSIELLADKIILGKDPPRVLNYAPLVPVTKTNVDQFEKNWKKWLRQN